MARTLLMQNREVREMIRENPGNLPMVAFTPEWFKQRPEHVRLVGEALMCWTATETYFAVLLSALLRSDTDATIAVYQTLRRSTPRWESILIAAQNVLLKEDAFLIEALLRHAKIVEKQRNHLAHGFWGASIEVRDGLAWISQEFMTLVHVEYNKNFLLKERKVISPGIRFNKLRDNTYIYTTKDLENIIKEIRELAIITNEYNGFISEMASLNATSLSDQARNTVTQFAPIAERMKVIQDREQKNQQKPIAE